jgi:hypothetical protein
MLTAPHSASSRPPPSRRLGAGHRCQTCRQKWQHDATGNEAILVETTETFEACEALEPALAQGRLKLRADVADEPSRNERLRSSAWAAALRRSEVRIPSAPPGSPGQRLWFPRLRNLATL